MTQSDLCHVCAHPLSEHPDGLACCPICGKRTSISKADQGYFAICPTCSYTHYGFFTKKAYVRRHWNMHANPSPWLNAPIPEEGEAQTLFVIADGTWNIAVPNKGYYKGFDSDEWTEIACGFNGGPAGKWTRTMRDGKLVYEEVKG